MAATRWLRAALRRSSNRSDPNPARCGQHKQHGLLSAKGGNRALRRTLVGTVASAFPIGVQTALAAQSEMQAIYDLVARAGYRRVSSGESVQRCGPTRRPTGLAGTWLLRGERRRCAPVG